MNARAYLGSALSGQTVGSRTINCGCGRKYSPEQFAKLERKGRQDAGGGLNLMLANCVCRSTIAMPWCGIEGCLCGDILNHPMDFAAEAEARHAAPSRPIVRSRSIWHREEEE